MFCCYLKLFVIESPIFSILEKVSEPVAVLQSIIHIVGDALPVGNGFGVALGNGGPLFGVESVVFITLKLTKKLCFELETYKSIVLYCIFCIYNDLLSI